MRALVAAALLCCAVPAGAQESPDQPAGESPIEFIVGDRVVTRAEVRRPIDQKSLADPKSRRKLYRAVRLKLAQDLLLYQYALHLGVNVTAEQVERVVARERRQHANATVFGRAISEMHGSLENYKELVKRRQTIGRLEARAAYGPELSAAQPAAPERILFSRHSQRAILDRCPAAAEHLAKTAPGELYELQISARRLQDAEAIAHELASWWRDKQDAAALRAELERRKLAEPAVRLKPIVLMDQGWKTEVYSPERATALYRAISALSPGEVASPVRQGGTWHLFWLKSVPRQETPSPEKVQVNVSLSLSQERASAVTSRYIREALRTTYVWPQELREELAEKHAKK